MNIPRHLRESLARRTPEPRRQRVLLALLLQAPPALHGQRRHTYRRPPMRPGGHPYGGLFASAKQD